MPTGYTAPVADGTITELSAFALRCAREFGALMHMRDDPMDAPVRLRSFNEDGLMAFRKLQEATERLTWYASLSPEQLREQHEIWLAEQIAAYQARLERREAIEGRYRAMFDQVRSWAPPTSEHVPLKELMLTQLRESIDGDCSIFEEYDAPPIRGFPDDWRNEQMEALQRDVEVWTKVIGDGKMARRQSNYWITELMTSLGVPAPTVEETIA